MKLFLSTVCLLLSGLSALDLASLSLTESDPLLAVLLEETESDESPILEKRQECKDSNSFACTLLAHQGYCRYGAIVKRCPESCDACADPTCRDSFEYGCLEEWCSIDYIADERCQRTCGTCHSTCKNTFKYGCKEEWCVYDKIAKEQCEKTCDTCNEDGDEVPVPDEGCPEGQEMCPMTDSCVDSAIFHEECFGNVPINPSKI